MGGKTSEMKKRFKNIFSEKKRKGRMAFILVGVLILSMCGFAFSSEKNMEVKFSTAEYIELLQKKIEEKICR